MSDLNNQIQYLKGVGPGISRLLAKLGVYSVKDLIYYFPKDYIDRSSIKRINDVNSGDFVIIRGNIAKIITNRTARGFTIIKAAIMDRSGILYAVWFNQPFILKLLKRGQEILVTGKAEFNSYTAEMEVSVRDYELVENGAEQIDPILPKYSLTDGLAQKRIRTIIKNLINTHLGQIIEYLPDTIKSTSKLIDLRPAIKGLHFPKNFSEISACRKRIVFDDFFLFQLGLLFRRKTLAISVKGNSFSLSGDLLNKFSKSLPFNLTKSQIKVLSEVSADMANGKAMSRLIQGDVGSGKTIIAAHAIIIAVQSGFQAAIMAPTEILAKQHYKKLCTLFKHLNINVNILVGSTKPSDKKSILSQLAGGKINIIIGTHALIEEKVKFKNLGMAVIDEQHRFGVLQRTKLTEKGKSPDLLFMTATPIPRSLALTLYGDLDRSIIDEMPPGRKPVKTIYVSRDKRTSCYEFIRSEVKKGGQVFVVCPLIEESEALDLKNAKLESEMLKTKIFPEFSVGLLHGKMKTKEKDEIMEMFSENKINILVSTTVIEVGLDIPNASIMLIEHAERFGLSQLHQLRGRIGRGADQSYCLLSADPKSEDGKARISVMLKSNDGFKIAEEDLKIRGPGDFYGVKQAGLPAFHLADIIKDEQLLIYARAKAIETLKKDPGLKNPQNLPVYQELTQRFGKFLELGMLN